MKAHSPLVAPFIGTAMAYAVAGAAALALSTAPGYVSPLWPAAGIALVSVLVYGWPMLAAIGVGSLLVNLGFHAATGEWTLAALAVPLTIAIGVSLEAAIGAWLVRRLCASPLALTEPREILRFFIAGGPLACVVSASVGVAALALAQGVAPSQFTRVWSTWWLGDSLGVLIAAPIALTFIGEPRKLWAPRRQSVAWPLVGVLLLAVLAIGYARRWDDDRAHALFERDATNAHAAIVQRLQQPLHALEAMHGLYVGSDDVAADEFRAASQAWLEGAGSPQALAWSERVRHDDVPEFEASARAGGAPDFAIFDRGPKGERLPPAGSELVAIRFIEPFSRNANALGLNVLSIEATRGAIETARRSDMPAASAGFQLTQERGQQTGVVVYRAIFRKGSTTPTARAAGFRGVLSVVLRIEDTLQPALAGLPAYLGVCLVDTADGAARRRLLGPSGCDARPAARWQQAGELEFAQRRWQVVISAAGNGLAGPADRGTWLLSIASLLATATFGALLLTMTGRARRIEAAVTERTAALQREIGERARTEAALRDSEQRFRNILNHVPIGVFYADLQGFIKHSNPKFRELVGYGADELAQMRAVDFTHVDDHEDDDELTSKLVNGDLSVYQRQKRYLRRQGQVVWVRTVVSLLRDAQGQPHRIVGVVEDITEHLKLQEAQTARENAEAANRAKNDFLSRMSHELRTPLNAMLGFAQLIELDRQQALSDSQREWIGQIQTAGWHLLEMINDTLDLSRIESGTLKLQVEAMDLPQVVTASLAMVERAANERALQLSMSLSEDAAQVSADVTRVKQIVINLLTNAVKYNVDGGSIHVATRVNNNGAVELAVTDTGLGMDEQQLAALFQPFNRLGRERSSQEGTGIGLVISQRLAELMGGNLTVQSIAGQGSTFALTLPRALPRAAPEGQALPLEEQPIDYRQRVVHYIEDNETNAVVMEGILAQRAQVKLRVSPTGLDGLAAIQARPPSLILLDMHLPDIDGLQLLRMLKDDPATAAIPVVVVSADAVATRIKAALEAGAEYYLTKPVNVVELLRLVDELLEQRDTLFG